jgi:hypothetical protein
MIILIDARAEYIYIIYCMCIVKQQQLAVRLRIPCIYTAGISVQQRKQQDVYQTTSIRYQTCCNDDA